MNGKPINIEPETREEKLFRYKQINPDYELCPHCSEPIILSNYYRHNDFECVHCCKWIRI